MGMELIIKEKRIPAPFMDRSLSAICHKEDTSFDKGFFSIYLEVLRGSFITALGGSKNWQRSMVHPIYTLL